MMRVLGFEELKKFIVENKAKKVMLISHSMADTDSVSSAFALAKLFQNFTIATPDFITPNSKRILERLGFNENKIANKFGEGLDLVIMLDVNNFEDCGAFNEKLESFRGKILIIDHHALQEIKKDGIFIFNDETYNSTASIIFELLKSLNAAIEKSEARLLAAGIISDAAEFRNSSPLSFRQIGELLEIGGIDYPSLLLDMQHIASPEDRKESLEDLFKAKILIKNGLLFVYGRVRYHANHSADDAMRLGADVALFNTMRENEISFSARLRTPLDKKYNIHLGKIMKKLAQIINGHGGGHPAAAGAYGPLVQCGDKFIDSFIAEVTSKVA